ncbi:uncharacterized protein LOC131178404 [Hevea brasiliensis]|uniref:uncharacterized protein LOC131178404 n=1 Tax=Hevea brasiliensis TaxID=3981 RepID=UPI0025D8376B|nr:uncharacterized protein LOC131178404 [Hevea brasiliensis]
MGDKTIKAIGQGSSSGLDKRKSFGGFGNRRFGRGRPTVQRPPRSIQQMPRGALSLHICETCDKTHGGVCYTATGACYNYGGAGNFARDCVSAHRSVPPTIAEGSVQARVYTKRQREEAKTSDVIAGIFSIFDKDVYVLFDPSSTHSYVSASIACSATIPCMKMDFDVLVTSPSGQDVRVN